MKTNEVSVEAPNSKESEMMVLGTMLADLATSKYAIKISCETLSKEDFYHDKHKLIFQAIKEAYRKGDPIDIFLICEYLKDQKKFEDAGGPNYIADLANFSGTSANIEAYCERLETFSQKRNLLQLAQDMGNKIVGQDDVNNVLTTVAEKLKNIQQRKSIKRKFPVQFLDKHEENFLLIKPQPKPMILEYCDDNGNPTGFLPKGIVSMLVGAGGVGKTHLLSQLAISVATGTLWLDTFTTTKYCGENKKGSVFLGFGENHYEDIHRLLYKASKKIRNIDIGEEMLADASKRIAPFSFCGQQASFLDKKEPSRYFRELKMILEDTAPKEGWTLIILDPVSRLMGADAEIDNAAATQFIVLLEELALDLPGNPTILFAHHVNKASISSSTSPDQTASRGASAITDGVRWQVSFSQKKDADSNQSELKMTKSNFTRIMEKIELKKDDEGFLERQETVTPTTSPHKY